jgi:hypothetical protein
MSCLFLDTSLYIMRVTRVYEHDDPFDYGISYRVNELSHDLRVCELFYRSI